MGSWFSKPDITNSSFKIKFVNYKDYSLWLDGDRVSEIFIYKDGDVFEQVEFTKNIQSLQLIGEKRFNVIFTDLTETIILITKKGVEKEGHRPVKEAYYDYSLNKIYYKRDFAHDRFDYKPFHRGWDGPKVKYYSLSIYNQELETSNVISMIPDSQLFLGASRDYLLFLDNMGFVVRWPNGTERNFVVTLEQYVQLVNKRITLPTKFEILKDKIFILHNRLLFIFYSEKRSIIKNVSNMIPDELGGLRLTIDEQCYHLNYKLNITRLPDETDTTIYIPLTDDSKNNIATAFYSSFIPRVISKIILDYLFEL